MAKIKIIAAAFLSCAIFAAGFFTAYKLITPHTVTIEKGPISSNTITTDTKTMSTDDLRMALDCFYTSQPQLGIENTTNGSYTLSAGLCERKWTRNVTISKRSPKNIIMPRVSLTTGFDIGAGANYARMLSDNFGLGGGIMCYKNAGFSIDIFGVFEW